MEEPVVNESVEDQATASSEGPDVTVSQAESRVVSVDAEAVTEGASESVSEDTEGESGNEAESELLDPVEEFPPPGARARAESEAERAQRLAEARHGKGDDEVDTSDLICTVHGGELRQAPGKYRWMCDRVQEPGSCVAGYRE